MMTDWKLEVVRDWKDFCEWMSESVNGDEELAGVEEPEEAVVGELVPVAVS